MRSRVRANQVEKQLRRLGREARTFHLELRRRPVKTTVHLRRLLNLVRLYGRQEVLAAIARANEYQTYDAAYVETILLQERRRRELPSPTQVRPQRQELIEEIDLESPIPESTTGSATTNEDQENQRIRRNRMSNRQQRLHELLLQDLAELKLTQIAETYREVLDEAARKNTSMLEVLATLIAAEVTARRQRALERRIRQAKLPPRKTLEDYDFTFPKRIPKQKILRLFDCEFVAQHQCAVSDWQNRNREKSSPKCVGVHRL